MIRVNRPDEPDRFNDSVRIPGNAWLLANPDKSPHKNNLWIRFSDCIAQAFSHRCGYTAINITEGEVEHYMASSTHPQLAYEWSNYRYSSSKINKRKWKHNDRIIDPFLIENYWFKVKLPEFMFKVTEQCPQEFREKAEFTIHKLKLNEDRKLKAQLVGYMTEYLSGNVNLNFIDRYAPLLGQAIRNQPEDLQSLRQFLIP